MARWALLLVRPRGTLSVTMKRILEVCDSNHIREMITQMGQRMGFEVVEAECGDEAIALFRERGPFDLVLTDLYYYDEIPEPPLSNRDCIRDGVQLARSIRVMKPDQAIAIHTGSQLQLTGELSEIPVLEKGTNEFFPKLRDLLNGL